MTDTRKNLLQVLCQIQNDAAHNHHDILTITGCGMTDAEVIEHIANNFEQSVRDMRRAA